MGRVKRQYISDGKEAYEDFTREYPEFKIDSKTWRNILREINFTYRDYALQTGERTKLPCGFGDISINKQKSCKIYVDKNGKEKIPLSINWKATKEKGKRIYNLNDHSEGYRFGWVFFRKTGRLKFSDCWTFKASRDSSRLLAKYIKDEAGGYQYRYRQWRY